MSQFNVSVASYSTSNLCYLEMMYHIILCHLVCHTVPGSAGDHGEESADLQCHLPDQGHFPHSLQPAHSCGPPPPEQTVQTLGGDETSQDEYWN